MAALFASVLQNVLPGLGGFSLDIPVGSLSLEIGLIFKVLFHFLSSPLLFYNDNKCEDKLYHSGTICQR